MLANEEVRAAIKSIGLADGAAIVREGKFVGGCDIVYEMYVNGSFIGLLKDNDLLKVMRVKSKEPGLIS